MRDLTFGDARRLVLTLDGLFTEFDVAMARVRGLDAAIALGRGDVAERDRALQEMELIVRSIRELGARFAPHDSALDGRRGVDWRMVTLSPGAS